jgi:hypothetical protein
VRKELLSLMRTFKASIKLRSQTKEFAIEIPDRMKPKLSTARLVWWSIGTGVAIVVLGLLTSRLTIQSAEISAARSPDGVADAVLLDVPRDAHGAHSAKVCLRRAAIPAYGQSICTRIAYLSGVPAGDRDLGIQLEWQSSTELEIQYREATAAYLYYPNFFWPIVRSRTFSRYSQNLTPIHARLVHTNVAENDVPAK